LRTGYDISEEFYDWPIYGRESILGIIRIPSERARVMSEAQLRLLHSMIESIALAMDRFRSSKQRIKAHEEAVQERNRSTLLRAISHDLRTPLSAIMGTSEVLMDMINTEDTKYSLVEGIYEDAEWLHSLVENILNLTRLKEGKLILDKQIEAVEEVIGSAVERIKHRSAEYEIMVSIPNELLLVPMDAIYKGMLWVQEHSAEEVAKSIQSHFTDADLEILTTVVDRYRSIDAWATDPILKEDGLNRLQDVMTEAGELNKIVPYDKIVNTKFAEEAMKNK